MRRRWVGSLVILAVSLAACTGGTTGSYSEAPDRPPGNGPPVPSGPTGAELTEDLKWIATPVGELLDVAKVRKIGAVGDIRSAWLLAAVIGHLYGFYVHNGHYALSKVYARLVWAGLKALSVPRSQGLLSRSLPTDEVQRRAR